MIHKFCISSRPFGLNGLEASLAFPSSSSVGKERLPLGVVVDDACLSPLGGVEGNAINFGNTGATLVETSLGGDQRGELSSQDDESSPPGLSCNLRRSCCCSSNFCFLMGEVHPPCPKNDAKVGGGGTGILLGETGNMVLLAEGCIGPSLSNFLQRG